MKKSAKNFPRDFGSSNRQLRVAELIRRSISDILIKIELYEDALTNVPITVSEVRCSSDLKLATVFVLPLGGKNAQTVVKSLAKQKSTIRKILGNYLKLKFVPDIRFIMDESFDQMDQTTKLLQNLNVQRNLLS